MNGEVIRIDTEVELKAIENGECGLCRLGATHEPNSTCKTTPLYKTYQMTLCTSCNYQYSALKFIACPMCNEDVRRKL